MWFRSWRSLGYVWWKCTQAVLGFQSTLVKHEHMLFPPACGSPLKTEDLPSMPRSWCLLSITGLAALGSAKWYGTPSEASIIRQISPGWVIFLQPESTLSSLSGTMNLATGVFRWTLNSWHIMQCYAYIVTRRIGFWELGYWTSRLQELWGKILKML